MRIELDRLGCNRDRLPAAYGGEWIDHVAWGVDSVLAAVRFLLCGQVVGAAVLARSQLERWTMNLAFNVGVSRTSGESSSQFAQRTWSLAAGNAVVRRSGLDPESVVERDSADDADEPPREFGVPIPIEPSLGVHPGLIMNGLSELLHGRHSGGACMWESHRLLDPDGWDAQCSEAQALILDALSLVCMRLRACVCTLLEAEHPARARGLMELPLRAPAGREPLAGAALWPVNELLVRNPKIGGSAARASDALAALVRGERPAGRLFRDDEMVQLAYLDHRHRAIHSATKAFELERERLGELNWENFRGRELANIITAETLALLADWLEEPHAAVAAACASSALRSAHWLWLEDDDRAMAALRCVLEQAARMRTWLHKPNRAAPLETRPTTAPKDWLDRAGWARLHTLNRALGELSHARHESRWFGAVELLAELQRDSVPDAELILTARGSALRMVMHLAAREAQLAVQDLNAELGHSLLDLFERSGIVTDEVEAHLNSWLARNLDLKQAPIKGQTWQGPAITD
jgi:hypothetical protein